MEALHSQGPLTCSGYKVAELRKGIRQAQSAGRYYRTASVDRQKLRVGAQNWGIPPQENRAVRPIASFSITRRLPILTQRWRIMVKCGNMRNLEC